MEYEESLKVYRDLKNVTDTAYSDGLKKNEMLLDEERKQKEEERRQKEEERAQKEEERAQKEEERKQKEEERRQKVEAIKMLHLAGIDKKVIADKLNIPLGDIEKILPKN